MLPFSPSCAALCCQIIWQLEMITMSAMFNTILAQEGIDPARVRLLRHQENKPDTIHTPYELWRDNRPGFEQYQSVQGIKNRPKFNFPIWASFVADPLGATLFVGLYSAKYIDVGKKDIPRPHRLSMDKAGMYDRYALKLRQELSDLSGKLYIDWGLGPRAWIQRAKEKQQAGHRNPRSL
jgi:hypothetical protein